MNKERIRYDSCPPLMPWAALRRCGRPFFLKKGMLHDLFKTAR
jgi:hypothetical protein